jgi:cation diffusion facilitator family transporter
MDAKQGKGQPVALVSSGLSGKASARTYALLSLSAALVTILLKAGAYLLTGSVGLLSDAVESLVNLVAALVAIWALTLASRPPDAEHSYGHAKAEYFASAVEGLLILVAAVGIGAAAWDRLRDLRPLAHVESGVAIAVVAAAVNGAVALVLLRAGRRLRSITLVADAHHLLTDVWTSAGVTLGVGLVQLTGWPVATLKRTWKPSAVSRADRCRRYSCACCCCVWHSACIQYG